MIIVQKFGGTSVNTLEKQNIIVEKIREKIDRGDKVILIVSAMGRLGDNYSTDTLLSLLPSDATLREKDQIMACGEIITASIIASKLNSSGIKAESLKASEIRLLTDLNYGDAQIISIDNKKLKENIELGIVSVVCGFQGMGENNETTTLGRGGSNISTVLIAKEVEADLIEIYTDVEGVFEEDPKINKNAKLIKEMTFNELCMRAERGEKIMCEKSGKLLKYYKIKTIIKGLMTKGEGTKIER